MATARKKSAPKSLTKTKKFGKKTYKKTACSLLKLVINMKAKNVRKTGRKARVVKNPAGGYCLFTAGAARKAKVAGTKRRVVRRKKS